MIILHLGYIDRNNGCLPVYLSLHEKWVLKVQKYLKILPESTVISFLLKSM